MDAATESALFDLVMLGIKALVSKWEDAKAGKTTAAQAHADISATLATIGGATGANDQMADAAEAAKYPGQP